MCRLKINHSKVWFSLSQAEIKVVQVAKKRPKPGCIMQTDRTQICIDTVEEIQDPISSFHLSRK